SDEVADLHRKLMGAMGDFDKQIERQSKVDRTYKELDRVNKQTVDGAVTFDALGQPNSPDNTALAMMGDGSARNVNGSQTYNLWAEATGATTEFDGRSGATKAKLH